MLEDDVSALNAIYVDHSYSDSQQRCMAMFAAWLQRTPKASWKQLIEALKDLKLIQLVSELEELLIPSELSEIKDAAHGKVCRSAINHVYGQGV